MSWKNKKILIRNKRLIKQKNLLKKHSWYINSIIDFTGSRIKQKYYGEWVNDYEINRIQR